MLKEKLYEMKSDSEGIRLFVLEDILAVNNNDEEIEDYIDNVLSYGCVSGCVTSLIYYEDTDKFFSQYYDEILEMVNELNIWYGISFEINPNNLSWFAYEETIKAIATELGIY